MSLYLLLLAIFAALAIAQPTDTFVTLELNGGLAIAVVPSGGPVLASPINHLDKTQHWKWFKDPNYDGWFLVNRAYPTLVLQVDVALGLSVGTPIIAATIYADVQAQLFSWDGKVLIPKLDVALDLYVGLVGGVNIQLLANVAGAKSFTLLDAAVDVQLNILNLLGAQVVVTFQNAPVTEAVKTWNLLPGVNAQVVTLIAGAVVVVADINGNVLEPTPYVLAQGPKSWTFQLPPVFPASLLNINIALDINLGINVQAAVNLNLGLGDFSLVATIFPTSAAKGAILSQDLSLLGINLLSLLRVEIDATLKVSVFGLNIPLLGSASTLVSTSLTLNTWNQVAVVRSGLGVLLYINGVLAGQVTVAALLDLGLLSLHVGADVSALPLLPPVISNVFPGLIYDVKSYPVALVPGLLSAL